jgi:amino acid adenylation domain-containing protein
MEFEMISGKKHQLHARFEAPLSITQERVWFLSELNRGCSLFHTALAVRFEGMVDVAILKGALGAVVERHQALRSTLLLNKKSRPLQVIHLGKTVELATTELSPSKGEREAELGRLIADLAAHPFDLVHEFPWRATLLKLTPDEHVLLFVAHRMFFDVYSKAIFCRDLATSYRAFAQGYNSALPALPIEYTDHVSAQRQYMGSEALKSDLAYWKQKLSGLRSPELPTDRPRPAVQSFRAAQESFVFGQPLSEQLQTLCRENSISMSCLLLSAFKTLLYRYTGEEDIAVGWAVSGRRQEELEGLIGCFENTLVLRSDLSGNPHFTELLDRLNRTSTEGLQHQDVPFATLVKEFAPGLDRSRSPLVQITFAHESVTSVYEFPTLTVNAAEVPILTTEFDLTLRTFDTSQGLSASLEYSVDLFDAVTIRRMLGHFETLLHGIASEPAQRIFDLRMLTDAETHQLLVEWNDTQKDYPTDRCVHELFQAQVERSPDSIAIACGNRELTYRELNSRANQIAHYLRNHGVGPEVLVGICAKRSLDMVVGLIGILKAGAAYVPLDPAYPEERLAFVLKDAQVSLLLTEQQLINTLPSCDGLPRLGLDSDWNLFAKQKDTDPQPLTTSKNLAYVIYTSGSTGTPKGVAIEHLSVTTFLCWAHGAFTREDLTGVLASTSICFDLSVFELFAPLTCGGKVILAENALALPSLPQWNEVRLVNTVPSVIAELVRMNAIPSSVRIINLAGEPLSTTLVQQIYRGSSVNRVYDLYGPSEDTTYSTFALRTPDGPKTIGRPISNTQVYILDGHMNPVPIGIPGRLYIGGDGLARGYLNRPDLTAEKFIPDTFSGKPGARLYNTGDLARYLPDGNIDFLGRIDNQVKVRGFRIELGEIEAVLCQHPAVREAAAVVREDTPNQKSLVAYVTSGNQQSSLSLELRRYLETKLPPYMVPSAIVTIDGLPLTPNGKVDRRALPAPAQRTGLAQSAVPPRTAAEKTLGRIWATLLKTDQIGIHDNFFELGGDSLLALRLLNAVNKQFHKEVPLTAVFQAPTIEQLAKQIAPDKTLPTWSSLYAIQPHGPNPPFVWIHGENSDAVLPRYLGPDQPLYGVRHQSEDGRAARYRNILDIAKHYLTEIRMAQPHGPYFLGGYCIGGAIAFEIAQQLKKSDEDVRLVVMLEPATLVAPELDGTQNAKSFTDKIYQHWGRLSSLPAREKALYVFRRGAARITEKATKASYNTSLALGRPISPAIRRQYIVDIYEDAMTHYVPEIYPGRLTIIRVPGTPRAHEWERFASEGADDYVISGTHRGILMEPHVHQWAEIIRAATARAQADHKTRRQVNIVPPMFDRVHSVSHQHD